MQPIRGVFTNKTADYEESGSAQVLYRGTAPAKSPSILPGWLFDSLPGVKRGMRKISYPAGPIGANHLISETLLAWARK